MYRSPRAATRMVVLARTGDAPGDIDLFLVSPEASGVNLEQKLSVASDSQYDVTFDGVLVDGDERIGAGDRRVGRPGNRSCRTAASCWRLRRWAAPVLRST